MRLACLVFLLVACALAAAPGVYAQQAETVEPAYEFFSGTIAEMPEGRIVVSRAIQGKPAEQRTFLLAAETKVEGKLKLKARVTVGYRSTDDGDVAARIIVRNTK